MKQRHYAAPYLCWMALFIVVPLLIVLYYGLTVQGADGSLAFSLENIQKAFTPAYMKVLWRSIWMAGVATILCLLIGYPTAKILASRDFKKGSIVLMLIIIPMWMNFLLRTYAWINLLNDNGLIQQILHAVGIQDAKLLYNTGAVIVGLVYNFLPFMILPIYSVMVKIEPHLIEAAEDLGANNRTVFRRVIWPLSMPGVVSGIVMCFMPAVTTFAVSRLLGGSMFMMYGDLIENQFYFMRDWHFGATLSIVMMALVLLSMLIFRRKGDAEGGLMF